MNNLRDSDYAKNIDIKFINVNVANNVNNYLNTPVVSTKYGSTRERKSRAVITWKEYTERTTFHGVRYIFENRSSIIRRILWLTLVAVAILLFGYQVIARVQEYYRYKANVDVSVMYTERMKFPAVTICNQNMYRMSAAFKYGMYSFLDNHYGYRIGRTRVEHKLSEKPSLANVTDFIVKSAHQKLVLIESCFMNGKPCNIEDDFRIKLTDYGVCYTFNSEFNNTLYINESGRDSGLRLIFNVEQYEYMRGPQNDAGVKILLHDQDDEPLVGDFGFAVAPGMHTMVDVKQIQSIDLEPPYGNCSLDTEHALSRCLSECYNHGVMQVCGCWPWNAKSTPQSFANECNVTATFECVPKAIVQMRTNRQLCKCKMPCEKTSYEPSLSYATISQFNADRMVDDDTNKMAQLREAFYNARNAYQRAVPYVASKDEKQINKLLSWFKGATKIITELYSALENTKYLEKKLGIIDMGTTFYEQVEMDHRTIDRSLDLMMQAVKSVTLQSFISAIPDKLLNVKTILDLGDDSGEIDVVSVIQLCANTSSNSSKLCNISSNYWNDKIKDSYNLAKELTALKKKKVPTATLR